MMRIAAVGLACLSALVIQAWTWASAPREDARHALIQSLITQIEPGDEVAWIPGWEHGFARTLEEAEITQTQRLGALDLMRPAARLWLLKSADAQPWEIPEGVRLERRLEQSGMEALLLARQGRVEPMAWPQLGGCQLSLKRKRCSADGGGISYGEINFDGTFAHGFKIRLGRRPMKLVFKSATGAQLLGGLGFTGHGARHVRGPVRARWTGAQAGPVAGVIPARHGMAAVALTSSPATPLVLVLESDQRKDVELGLSVGWWSP